MSLHCKLVSGQYQEYDINLLLIIFLHMSLHCKLVPVQYQEYDINLLVINIKLSYLRICNHYKISKKCLI